MEENLHHREDLQQCQNDQSGLSRVTHKARAKPCYRPTPRGYDTTNGIKDKAELETLCLAEAGRQFMQASQTPLLKAPLLDIFTEANLSTKAFNQVLKGTFQYPTGTDPMAQRLITALQCPTSIDKNLIKRTIPMMSLHWQNDWNKITRSWSEKCDQCNKDNNDKTSDRNARWASRRELVDESSTRLHYPYEYSQQSYGQGLAPSRLATMRSFTELEALNCETRGKLS